MKKLFDKFTTTETKLNGNAWRVDPTKPTTTGFYSASECKITIPDEHIPMYAHEKRGIKLTIIGDVPSKKSSQIFIPKLKRLIPNQKYTQYKNDFGKQIPWHEIRDFCKLSLDKNTKLGIHIDLYYSGRITVRDIVNSEQSVWDCLQDFRVIDDDSQFYTSSATKALDKENPRAEIKIWVLQ